MKEKNIKIDLKNQKIVPMTEKELINCFKVLGDKVRYEVAKKIFHNPGISGKEILVDSNMSQPCLSFHIAQLKKCKLICEKKEGQSHTYFTNYDRIISFQEGLIKTYGEFSDFICKICQKEMH